MTAQASSQTQALILLFKTMPEKTQKEFTEWIVEHPRTWENSTEQEDSDFWLEASSDALGQLWGDPAEDVWDEIYKKHKADGRLQAI
jgi:hypothetical protein